MIEKYMEALEQYDMKILSVRRGRGSWICDTEDGCRLLKEYRGTPKRLEFEDQVLGRLDTRTSLRADRYVRNKEDGLITTASDGVRYILKEWFEDRECSMKDGYEIRQALSRLAMLHRQLRAVEFREEWDMGSSCDQPLEKELERHNREMQRTRNYIRSKRQKSDFELCVIETYSTFWDQASQAAAQMAGLWREEKVGEETEKKDREYWFQLEAAQLGPGRSAESVSQSLTGLSPESVRQLPMGSPPGSACQPPADSSPGATARPLYLCHGDLDHHHVLMGNGYTAIIEYNRMRLGLQASDLYRFMRKVMEKHNWNLDLGLSMLDAYERVLPMEKQERASLYCMFLYPEKYWKQLNFYYNANKAWIPARNTEKLRSLQQQQPARNSFLKRLEADCLQ